MSVRQKESLAVSQNLLPWRGYWKMQKHLIHFAVAITTYRNYPRRLLIQTLGDLRWRVALWQRITRPMVQYIAQYHQPLRTALGKPFKYAFRSRQRTMNVLCEHQFHHSPLVEKYLSMILDYVPTFSRNASLKAR